MTCYHPLIRYETWEKYTCNDGHKAYRATVEKLQPGSNYEDKEEAEARIGAKIKKIQIIPCGKCIGCRLEYSRDWATKGCYEAESHLENWFLTITYDQEHLPEAQTMIDPKTGEELKINPNGTLKNTDFTLFLKKLRSYYERKYNHKKIRYMGCGEYGSEGQRPHYHAIMYNLPLFGNIQFHEYNENHEPLWRCPELETIWGKGMVVAAQVNWNTCAYVARYITKKIGLPTEKEHYKALGIEPEFFRMSRKPGIGREYFEKHKDEIYDKDKLIIQKYGGGTLKIKPPKYYDRLYDIENHEKMEEIKKKRKKDSERINILKYNQTTSWKKNQLLNEEDTKKAKNETLKRNKL